MIYFSNLIYDFSYVTLAVDDKGSQALTIDSLSLKLHDMNIQGVPKNRDSGYNALGRGLEIKVWWVFRNLGNFQSNEHRNFVFLSRNDRDIKAQK